MSAQKSSFEPTVSNIVNSMTPQAPPNTPWDGVLREWQQTDPKEQQAILQMIVFLSCILGESWQDFEVELMLRDFNIDQLNEKLLHYMKHPTESQSQIQMAALMQLMIWTARKSPYRNRLDSRFDCDANHAIVASLADVKGNGSFDAPAKSVRTALARTKAFHNRLIEENEYQVWPSTCRCLLGINFVVDSIPWSVMKQIKPQYGCRLESFFSILTRSTESKTYKPTPRTMFLTWMGHNHTAMRSCEALCNWLTSANDIVEDIHESTFKTETSNLQLVCNLLTMYSCQWFIPAFGHNQSTRSVSLPADFGRISHKEGVQDPLSTLRRMLISVHHLLKDEKDNTACFIVDIIRSTISVTDLHGPEDDSSLSYLRKRILPWVGEQLSSHLEAWTGMGVLPAFVDLTHAPVHESGRMKHHRPLNDVGTPQKRQKR